MLPRILLAIAYVGTQVALGGPPVLNWSATLQNMPEFEAADQQMTPTATLVRSDHGPASQFAVAQLNRFRVGDVWNSFFRLLIYDHSGDLLIDTGWEESSNYPFPMLWTREQIIVFFRRPTNELMVHYKIENGSYQETERHAVSLTEDQSSSFIRPNAWLVDTEDPTSNAVSIQHYTITETIPVEPVGIVIEVNPPESATLIWSSQIEKTYRVQKSSDMITWATLDEVIPGTGDPIKRTYATSNEKLFFRLISN